MKAKTEMRGAFVLLAVLSVASAGPIYPALQPQEQRLTPELKAALIKDLQNDILKVAALRAAAESIKLEEAAEDSLLKAAVDTLNEEPSPEQAEHLKQVEQLLKRDKRAVQLLQGILGGSSGGGGGGEASASVGSDSGSILNLVGPILGSSSGGGGGSSGGDGAGGQGPGGSDSSSILNLVGPLLGSSSGGSSGGEGSASGSGGSDSSSILNLVGPLLGSSSGGSGGDGSGGGGGSGLGSILSLSSGSSGSSSGGSSGGDAGAGGDYGPVGGNSIISQIKGAKFALVGDKIQLLLRVKFGILNKILNVITHKIATLSLPPEETASLQHLKYPS